MKKVILLSTFILIVYISNAGTINSLAITIGASAGNQKFYSSAPSDISRKKYVFGFNASVFAEVFNGDFTRWVTEIQYNQKGSIDRQPTGSYANQLQYISWNNYLKVRYELFSIIPYVLVGPRLEYNLSQATSSPQITGKFLPFHVSAAAGAGLEFVNYFNIKFFVEGFYNPDIMPAYISPELHVTNKNFELRVGLKYELKTRRESCNTPTFVE